MDCWHSPYELRARTALSARTERRIYRGALIRVGAGFGCLHPWPELGDPTLADCLADLGGRRELSLVRRALYCAQEDGRAREEGRSLFESLKVPMSHFLMPELSGDEVSVAVGRGFQVVKVKVGRRVGDELEGIRNLGREWPEIKWRLDFNGCSSICELRGALSRWSEEELARIDFIEDPARYDPDEWRDFPLPLANDREALRDEGRSEVVIWKPAAEELAHRNHQRLVVTSYLDHPLGQVYAAWEAAKQEIGEICGLQSHGNYEKTRFSEALGRVDPEFRVPEGLGLGFDALLDREEWLRVP